MAIHIKGCGHAIVELCVDASANVVIICSIDCLIACEAKCHPSNGSNFIVHFLTCALNIETYVQYDNWTKRSYIVQYFSSRSFIELILRLLILQACGLHNQVII